MKFYKLVGREPVLTDMSDVESMSIENRRLCSTMIGDIHISTIFLWIDHNFRDYGPPILFETMVFAPSTEAWDHWMQRYSHYSEAVDGHNKVVEEIKAAVAESNNVVGHLIERLQT